MNERNTQILKIFELALMLRESGKPAYFEMFGSGIVTVSVWDDEGSYQDWLERDGKPIYRADIYQYDEVEKVLEVSGCLADLLGEKP